MKERDREEGSFQVLDFNIRIAVGYVVKQNEI